MKDSVVAIIAVITILASLFVACVISTEAGKTKSMAAKAIIVRTVETNTNFI